MTMGLELWVFITSHLEMQSIHVTPSDDERYFTICQVGADTMYNQCCARRMERRDTHQPHDTA
jgi:hypothetical protein